MTDEQLAALRCYTSAEVVQMLNMKPKWLKDLVRDRRVPHQRTGPTRGVWFTADDIIKIGEMLPDLLSHRRLSAAAGPGDVQQDRVPTGPAQGEPPAQKLAEWAQLTAHKRRPRRPS